MSPPAGSLLGTCDCGPEQVAARTRGSTLARLWAPWTHWASSGCGASLACLGSGHQGCTWMQALGWGAGVPVSLAVCKTQAEFASSLLLEAGSRDAEPSVRPEGSCSVEAGSRGHSCWPGAQPRSGSPTRGRGAGVLPVVLTHSTVRGLGTGACVRGRQRFPGIPEADRPAPGGAGCGSEPFCRTGRWGGGPR